MSDLNQQLWEFIYDLLPEEEAAALREQITSDPQVARAYALAKLQTEMVERAARVDAAGMSWQRPDEGGEASDSPTPRRRDHTTRRAQLSRATNWLVGIAAIGLVCLMGSSFLLQTSSPRARPPVALVPAPRLAVRLRVAGPPQLHLEATNSFAVRTTDGSGLPIETDVDYRVFDVSGNVTLEATKNTDVRGHAWFDLPGPLVNKASRLEVVCAGKAAAISHPLRAEQTEFVTYLRTDRPLFQPAERVSFRSVTLSRYALRMPDDELVVEYEIDDANGNQLAGSHSSITTEKGVGSGFFRLPDNLPSGRYALVARSPKRSFLEERCDFEVRRFKVPRWTKELKLSRDSYTAGDRVEAEFKAERATGGVAVNVPLCATATTDQRQLTNLQAKTNDQGEAKLAFNLPQDLEEGQVTLAVTVGDGEHEAETIAKPVPINLGKVNVDFYPEGGNFVAGLPNRVYFYSRDPLGKPVHLEGRILNDLGHEVTHIATIHDGRGRFALQTTPQRRYRLVIDQPVGVTKEVALPRLSESESFTIDTGSGVFATSEIALSLHAKSPTAPLVIAASCRGAMVSEMTVDPGDFLSRGLGFSTFQGKLPLSGDAQGVVRLTVMTTAVTVCGRLRNGLSFAECKRSWKWALSRQRKLTRRTTKSNSHCELPTKIDCL